MRKAVPRVRPGPIAWTFLVLAFAGALACGVPARSASPENAGAGQQATTAPRTASAVLARILTVDDGDSFIARRHDGARIRVRLAGIDAPEKSQPWANRAREKLRGLLREGELRIEPIKTDRWGRFVANVEVEGKDVSLAMLEAGLAWHYARYDGDLSPQQARRYATAAAAAREAGAGLWRADDPEPPWQFRRRKAGQGSRR